MKALRKLDHGPGLETVDIPTPEVGPRDCLVRVEAASICVPVPYMELGRLEPTKGSPPCYARSRICRNDCRSGRSDVPGPRGRLRFGRVTRDLRTLLSMPYRAGPHVS
jgi:hypothetical protein